MITVSDLYVFKARATWTYLKTEKFSFWMICFYLFFEYVRPQAIYPAIDVLPWAQTLILLSLVGSFLDKTVKWVKSPINPWLILFALTILISSVLGYYPSISKNHYIDFFPWVLIYFLIINIVNTKERFYIFLVLYILAAGKIAVGTSKSWAFRGFSFTDWGLLGPHGYFHNSGELAILMLMLFPLAYKLYEATKDDITRLEKYILILLWVTPILTILGSSSRGAQIALALQVLLIFRKNIFRLKNLILLVILTISAYQLLPSEQKERFASIGEDKSSEQRMLYWTNGLTMLKEHPLLGVGYYNFIPYYNNEYPEDVLYKSAELPHNIFIQVGTDAGIIGLFFFVFIVIKCLLLARGLTKDSRVDAFGQNIAAGLGYGIVGFVIAGQFVSVAYYPFMWIGAAQIAALWNTYRTTVSEPINIRRES